VVMPSQNLKLNYGFRLYVLHDGQRVIGKGGAQILTEIDHSGSMTATAKKLKMPYRFVREYIRRTENRVGKPVIATSRGKTTITPLGKMLLKDYRAMERRLQKVIRSSKPLSTPR